MAIDILNRWKRAVIYSSATASDLRAAVLEARSIGADLRGADLTDAVLRGADLTDAVLRGADLRGADLTGAVLRGADLRGADLTDAVLRGADLRGADLTGADLRGADLTDAVLRGAVLRGADLTGAGGKLPTIIDIHQKVFAAASQSGALEMNTWHTCETTHCRAGWVVMLAGDGGSALEWALGTPVAAALIYQASDPGLKVIPDFYASNEAALADMKRLAEEEAARK